MHRSTSKQSLNIVDRPLAKTKLEVELWKNEVAVQQLELSPRACCL